MHFVFTVLILNRNTSCASDVRVVYVVLLNIEVLC